MHPSRSLSLACCAALAFIGTQAHASISTFTDLASFDTAISGYTGTTKIDFDTPATSLGAAAFTVSGSTAVGLNPSVSTSAPAGDPNAVWTTSGSSFLGVNDPGNLGQLSSGDSVTFTFAQPVYAFGLYAIAGSDTDTGDFTLVSGATSLVNGTQASALTDGHGSYAYFLGVVATTPGEGLKTFTLNSDGSHLYFYGIDDVRYAAQLPVPEPSTWALLLAGAGCMGAIARRAQRSDNN